MTSNIRLWRDATWLQRLALLAAPFYVLRLVIATLLPATLAEDLGLIPKPGALITALSNWSGYTGTGGDSRRVNLRPFATILETDQDSVFRTVVANLIVLLPLGLFLAVFKVRPLRAVLVILMVATVIELLQIAVPDRAVDVDDMLLAACGAIAGFFGASLMLRGVEWLGIGRGQR